MDGKETCCPYCIKKHTSFQKLKIHIDAVHPDHGEKKFSCNECKKDFIFESSYEWHKYIKHQKEKKSNHVCTICGYENANKTRLNDHMIELHNADGATQLICETCGFTAITRGKYFFLMLIRMGGEQS